MWGLYKVRTDEVFPVYRLTVYQELRFCSMSDDLLQVTGPTMELRKTSVD
jgi:hypothetical protein